MASDDVIILGGGFAGLSCAAALSQAGLRVSVIEKKPHLGGRAYSFRDAATGDAVDNGQHLFMGCYRQTRLFLERIGAAEKLSILSPIRVDFAEPGGRRDALRCLEALGAPLHLAWGVLGLRGLSWRDKAGLWALDRALRRARAAGPGAELDRLTVRQWLNALGQTEALQRRLLDPIALGVLNDDPAVAAATGFVQAMTRMFYDGTEASRLGLSTVGLSELYTDAARNFVERRSGRVLLSAKVLGVESGAPGPGVRLESGEVLKARHVVSTLPPWDLKRLERPAAWRGPWEALAPAPIVSVCLWLDRPALLNEPLVGLLGTRTHWVFNKSRILGRAEGSGQYLSLVLSGARREVGLSPKELVDLAARDLRRCFPEAEKATIKAWKVVKEPFATLSPVPGSEALRPEARSAAPGLWLAGDWTKTGLPATIESAVASGHRVAELIIGGRDDA